jgi:hypothetical protein
MTTKTAREILNSARTRETTLRLCLRGDLAAEHEALEARLADLTIGAGWNSLAGGENDAAVEVAERLAALREEMLEDTVEFTFRALKRRTWDELLSSHKTEDGGLDVAALSIPLISACLVAPAMTPAEVDELFDMVNEGQRDALFGAAFNVNMEATEVPFSERASAVMRARAPK